MKRLGISIKIALISFCIGTVLFLSQLFVGDFTALVSVGLFFILIATVINLFALLALIVALIVDDEKLKTLQSIGVIISNIPIALGYAYIIIFVY